MLDVKFVLRMPARLHNGIKRSAKKNNTSMNREMVNVLSAAIMNGKTDINTLTKRLEDKGVI